MLGSAHVCPMYNYRLMTEYITINYAVHMAHCKYIALKLCMIMYYNTIAIIVSAVLCTTMHFPMAVHGILKGLIINVHKLYNYRTA